MVDRKPRVDLAPDAAALVDRLLRLALRGLPRMYRQPGQEFAFTRAADASGALELRGTSGRYAAITALGVHWLPEAQQRQVLGGNDVIEFVGLLVGRLPQVTNLGEVALVTWAAAQAGHPLLPQALDRLRAVDDLSGPQQPSARYVVEASWVVSALAAARTQADVEEYLRRARQRLLASRRPGSPLFPHATTPGLLPWYRTHVACFADQVYPIQALARLHAGGEDAEALAAATACADRICQLQGQGGQWWWHYNMRDGDLVEGYPVYSVHQHAMGPMALLDLTDAGGPNYRDAIERGLRWMTNPAELGPAGEPLILDEEGLTWRKVYRGDPHKVVRAAHGVATRAVGIRMPGIDLVYPPTAIDRECRPYEFGWLLFAWLHGQDPKAPIAAEPALTAEPAAEAGGPDSVLTDSRKTW